MNESLDAVIIENEDNKTNKEIKSSKEKDCDKLLREKFNSSKKYYSWALQKKRVLEKKEIEKDLGINSTLKPIFIRIALIQKIEEEIEEDEFLIVQKSIASSLAIHFGSKIISLDRE